MAKIGVIYYSRGGNPEKMAEFVAQGVNEEGIEVELKKVEDTTLEDLLGTHFLQRGVGVEIQLDCRVVALVNLAMGEAGHVYE